MNRPAVPGIRVRGQPNLQRVSGVGIRLLVRKAGAMAEPTKYIWCQHCYTGWTTKEDKWYYPKCWSCGMGWRKRSRRPQGWGAKDTWDAQWPKELGYYPPPGLGRAARAQMSATEYRAAVAQLWGSADPGTQRLLRAARGSTTGPGRGGPRPKNGAKQCNQCLQVCDCRAEGTGGKKGHATGQSGPNQS